MRIPCLAALAAHAARVAAAATATATAHATATTTAAAAIAAVAARAAAGDVLRARWLRGRLNVRQDVWRLRRDALSHQVFGYPNLNSDSTPTLNPTLNLNPNPNPNPDYSP